MTRRLKQPCVNATVFMSRSLVFLRVCKRHTTRILSLLLNNRYQGYQGLCIFPLTHLLKLTAPGVLNSVWSVRFLNRFTVKTFFHLFTRKILMKYYLTPEKPEGKSQYPYYTALSYCKVAFCSVQASTLFFLAILTHNPLHSGRYITSTQPAKEHTQMTVHWLCFKAHSFYFTLMLQIVRDVWGRRFKAQCYANLVFTKLYAYRMQQHILCTGSCSIY